MDLMIVNAQGESIASSKPCGHGVALVHQGEYKKGDRVRIRVDTPGCHYLQLDECMGRHIVYLLDEAEYTIPIREAERTCYPPSAFRGDLHYLTLETVDAALGIRNLACNPYDHAQTKGMFPHIKANVETRGEMIFAGRNAIDGIFANEGHGQYPYTSWGINRRADAALHLDFARPVSVRKLCITLRADWPHDSWWTEATVEFDQKTARILTLSQTARPQCFSLTSTICTSLTLKNLLKADDGSPFPALTQLEVWGEEIP
ncbi:MAG: carbohydrate-binding protein [Sphaerochaeta sp.]|jgi:hypothetical protein|uniref:carbohydrate-binding protein n=1 Tax=Sphaerochaeta sp. TaxID=1972642 RepID=UPI003D13AD01